MMEPARAAARQRKAPGSRSLNASVAAAGWAPSSGGPTPADALALQRSVGNRAATRALARWAAHPDKDKKGVLMTDAMAAHWNRFNPPLSK